MKALVTGGAGFIGSHVVRQLIARGENVRVLHLPNEKLDNLKGLNVELVSGNVLDRKAVDKAVMGCDKVYHLAAIYAFWLPNPQIMFDVNVNGTKNVFDSCIEHKIKKVVYTSSIARYGGQGKGNVSTEESDFGLMRTGELYTISKYLSHELAEEYAKNKGLNLTIVCPVLPIGPGDIAPTPTGKYLIGVIKNPYGFYTDTITNTADVRDIAMGHLLAMDKGERGRSYILGGLRDITMKEILEITLRVAGKKSLLIKVPDNVFVSVGYIMEIYADLISQKAPMITSRAAKANILGLKTDCSRAVRELGYTCRPVEESIKDSIDWFKANSYI
jgi:dihydroflavonol-4-reductase